MHHSNAHRSKPVSRFEQFEMYHHKILSPPYRIRILNYAIVLVTKLPMNAFIVHPLHFHENSRMPKIIKPVHVSASVQQWNTVGYTARAQSGVRV
jgi:hypothetical protein